MGEGKVDLGIFLIRAPGVVVGGGVGPEELRQILRVLGVLDIPSGPALAPRGGLESQVQDSS